MRDVIVLDIVLPNNSFCPSSLTLMRCRLSTRRISLRSLALAAFGALAPVAAALAQASITGRVTDAANGQPIVGVQIMVAGRAYSGRSGADGNYAIRNVA